MADFSPELAGVKSWARLQIKGFNLEAGHHFLTWDVLMDHPKPSV